IGSTQYQYSETETQKIKYLPLSRLSPGRDAGTGTVGAVSVPSLLNGTGTDIRGANRTVNNAIDIGAFETQVASATTLLTATTPGQSGGNPVVVTPFEYGQPINLSLKSAWNDNVPPTAAVSGTVSVVRSTDSKVLGVGTYGTAVNPTDISAGKSTTVTFNPGSAQYPTLLDIGTNSLVGVFSGDQNYATSQTTAFNIVITKATTSVTLDPLTRVLSGSPVTITGFVSTPNSLAPLAGEGGLVIEYKAPGAGTYTSLTSPSLTLTGSNPNKYSFSVTVPAGTFNPLGTYSIQAKFVAGGLNHYTNSDNDTFASTTQDVVDQAKIGLLFLDGSKTAVPSPATFPHFTQFYIRAVLATGIDATKRTGTVDLLDSAGTTVFSFPASDPNLTVSTGTASGLAAQGIADGTAVTFLDYSFANNTAATSLGLRADDLISARYNGYPTPGTNFYLGATTATQKIDLPGITAKLSLSGPASVKYGVPYTITANLDNNFNPTANFNGGTVSLVQVLPSPTTTVGTATVPTSPAANTFTGTFPNFMPTVGTQQYDATYSGDGFNYDPLTTTNPIGILSVQVGKAAAKYTSLPTTVYAAQSSTVPFSLTLSNNEAGASASAFTPTGTVSFYATSGASRILLGTSTNTSTSSGAFTFNYTTTAGGTFPLTIDYSGDGNYLSLSNQPFGTLIVPTIALNLGGNPANVARGAMVNFTATVTPAGTQVEQPGSVTFSFLQGATVVATAVVPRDNSNPGTYTLSTQLGGGTLNLPNGTYTVTASYAQGSGNYPNMVSAARTLNVGLASSTTNLTATTASTQYRYGESIALAATVAGAVGLPFGPANSTVSIFDGTTNLTPTPLAINAANASAPATQTQTLDSKTLTSALSVGSHSFQARYSGDGANYLASNSSVQSLNIVKADTTIAVSGITPASGIVASGGALTLQVTLSTPSYVEANAARPTGTVVFATGGTTLGTANVVNGVATLNINPTAIGNFSYTATYSGDGNYNAPSTPAQGSYTVASLNFSPLASSIIQRGSLLTLSAAVTPATGNNSATPLGSVNFVIPGTTDTVVASVPYNSLAGGVYSTTIDTGDPQFNLPVGAYNLVARYVPATGDAYPAMNSASQSLTVNRQATSTSLSTTPVNTTSVTYGSAITIGATVSSTINGGVAIPFSGTSTVRFLDGAALLATAGVIDSGSGTSPSSASGSFSTASLASALSVGSHIIQAQYQGDGVNYASSNSPTQTVTIVRANTSILASDFTISPSRTAAAGTTLTLSAKVTPDATVEANAQRPGGSISFIGVPTTGGGTSTTLGTGVINPATGIATITVTTQAVGSFNVTA
ncbi:MAG: beta strand repeat-containing protein, partial [Planctomycetota bacterium]